MFEILVWHRHFLLLSKPPGVSFHRNGGSPGLIRTLQASFPDEELLPVHRLDKVTSGLLLVARHKNAARELARQFKAGKVEKYYLALSDRRPKKKQGWVIGDMEPSRRGTWKLTGGRASPAITRFVSYSAAPGLRLFILQPFTGRTHQIRVAMKSLGAPILGDPVYSGGTGGQTGAERCCLHAFGLRFAMRGRVHSYLKPPDSGRHFLRQELATLLAGLPEPWDLSWPEGGPALKNPGQ